MSEYKKIDEALETLINTLKTPTPEGHLYVPMPETVFLLRRLNALCARNMRATHWFVADEPKKPSKGIKRL